MTKTDILVIGAGWAGLTAARSLQEAGRAVIVVDKARGPGGRSSTRRQAGFTFDHGAQYFTARTEPFSRQVERWRAAGLVAAWDAKIGVVGTAPRRVHNAGPGERLVGVPGMNAVLQSMGQTLDCRFGWQVAELTWSEGWMATTPDGDSIVADHLVVAAPPQQSAALLGSGHPLFTQLQSVPMAPCWALMLGYSVPLDAEVDALFINDGPLSWAACNGSKPGRAGHSWVVHATPEWSQTNLEAEPESVAKNLLRAFRDVMPAATDAEPAFSQAHRWRFALSPEPLDDGLLYLGEQNLVIAGDWCAGNRIEGAWSSGRAAAKAMLAGHCSVS
ncbi:MAG: NAD(P)/FAD-dependent oxidoreductase [Wenzhouxiangella sp.]